ncbi:MAG: hypothetical protein GXP62_21180, partial [Oligoflexia bacterium]|nr:hypothetical protein [Oligoflexia bacterium]
GQHTAALQTIDRALSRGASGLQDARLHALAGQIYERLGDPARAAAAYRQAISDR